MTTGGCRYPVVPAPPVINSDNYRIRMTHEIETEPKTWYTYNVTDSCTVREIIDGETATLSVLATGGTGLFFASGNRVTLETNGKFRILPTKAPVMQTNGGSMTVEQSYTPNSTHPQSGTAVAQAFSVGSTVILMPAGAYYTMRHGTTLLLDRETEVLDLTPSTLTTAQEMRVLYTPAEARTTPLIAVPDSVTLHWAGDEEPTWEAGKNYIIQLLQTTPTHIEARLFNVPQGAKLPDWLNTAFYVARDSVTGVPVDARFEGQRDGNYQFENDAVAVTALADQLRIATFAEQIKGDYQFRNLKWNGVELSLPEATFESQTTGVSQFWEVLGSVPSSTLFLPKATFEALLNGSGLFNHNGSYAFHRLIYLPVATFENLGKGNVLAEADNFFAGCQAAIAPMATFRNVKSVYGFNRFTAYAGRPLVLEIPSATFENITTMGQFFYSIAPTAPCIYSINLRKLTSATDAWHFRTSLANFGEEWRETFLSLVYGPRLDENGVPTPVTKIDAETGLPATRDVSELTGSRLKGDGTRPTGWGIQDFRKVAADGTFERNAEGGYVYISTEHNMQLPTAASILPPELGGTSAAGEEVAEACRELHLRGWAIV